jgi:uncharacterized lipoprotein YmbA
MKAIKYLFFAVAVLMCHACASTTEPVQYYSLTLGAGQNTPAQSTTAPTARTVTIEAVHLAKFLRQDGIVTQVGDNEIAIASYHRWAEPLGEAIAKLLARDLNNKTSDYHFSWLQLGAEAQAPLKLRVAINEFNIKNNASVNIAGHYWLYARSSGLEQDAAFNITQPLKQDGYAHAVAQLRQAVAQLADKIIAALQKPLAMKPGQLRPAD